MGLPESHSNLDLGFGVTGGGRKVSEYQGLETGEGKFRLLCCEPQSQRRWGRVVGVGDLRLWGSDGKLGLRDREEEGQ